VGGGAHVRREAPKKIVVVSLYFFGSTSKISRFGERFCDGQYSLVSFLFAVLLLTAPPCQAIRKSGGTCHRVLWNLSVSFLWYCGNFSFCHSYRRPSNSWRAGSSSNCRRFDAGSLILKQRRIDATPRNACDERDLDSPAGHRCRDTMALHREQISHGPKPIGQWGLPPPVKIITLCGQFTIHKRHSEKFGL